MTGAILIVAAVIAVLVFAGWIPTDRTDDLLF